MADLSSMEEAFARGPDAVAEHLKDQTTDFPNVLGKCYTDDNKVVFVRVTGTIAMREYQSHTSFAYELLVVCVLCKHFDMPNLGAHTKAWMDSVMRTNSICMNKMYEMIFARKFNVDYPRFLEMLRVVHHDIGLHDRWVGFGGFQKDTLKHIAWVIQEMLALPSNIVPTDVALGIMDEILEIGHSVCNLGWQFSDTICGTRYFTNRYEHDKQLVFIKAFEEFGFQQGVTVKHKDPLIFSTIGNNPKLVPLLCYYGVDYHYVDPITKQTILYYTEERFPEMYTLIQWFRTAVGIMAVMHDKRVSQTTRIVCRRDFMDIMRKTLCG